MPVLTSALVRRSIAALLCLSVGSCVGPVEFVCDADEACGDGGSCEATHYCSFVDPACLSGRRYAEYAGALSRQCVGVEPIPDEEPGPASVDETPASNTSSTSSTTGGSSAATSDDPATTASPPPSDGSDSTTGLTPEASTGLDGSSSGGSDGDPVPDGASTGEHGGSTGGALPSCAEVFGALADPFEVCFETETVCRFGAQTNEGTCAALCAAVGAQCLHAWDNQEGTACRIDPSATDDCSIALAFQVCECSLPAV